MSVGKIVRPTLPFSNVAAQSIATCNITPGRTIEGIMLAVSGLAATASGLDIQTDISLVRVKANGKTIIEGSGAQLAALDEFRGGTHSDTFLWINFDESRKGRDFLDQMAGAFDTSLGVANITMEVTLAGNTGSGFTGTLKAYTVESGPQSAAGLPFAGLMSKILRYPYSVAAGGAINIPLPFGPVNGALIKRIHIVEGTAGRCTGVVIKQDGVVIHDTLDADNDQFNVHHESTNMTGYYSIDFVADGNLKNALDARDARSLELQPTFGAADSGYVIVEYLDKLGNL